VAYLRCISVIQNRKALQPLNAHATTLIPNMYRVRMTIAHASDVYMVWIDRLMTPVTTFA
jgi:hypothetical protein